MRLQKDEEVKRERVAKGMVENVGGDGTAPKKQPIKEGKWTPCKWEDCKDTDRVLLRANSLNPCDIERLEDHTLFFDLVDDMDAPSQIVEA